jgi:hypothetical protein
VKRLLIIIAAVLIVVNSVVSVGVLWEHYHHKYVPRVAVTKTTPKAQPTTTKSVAVPTYKVGDTQTDGSLSVTLTKTYSLTQQQVPMPIASGDLLFGVNLTVTNNGPTPAIEQIGTGFTELSSVYTQVGSDTSTGKYVLPDTGNESAACFGNSTTVIAPGQTVSSCVQFLVPTNALADTYYFNDLKWYL